MRCGGEFNVGDRPGADTRRSIQIAVIREGRYVISLPATCPQDHSTVQMITDLHVLYFAFYVGTASKY